MNYNSLIKNPKVKITAIVIAVVLMIVILVVSYFKLKKGTTNLIDVIKNKQLADEADAEINPDNISLTQVQINTLADKLHTAMSGMGTDEDAIFAVFNSLNTRSDLLQLIKTFGYRDGETLQEWLVDDLSTSDISHINSILASRNINYIF
jgi:predicted PurR-regulated permease PerM